MIYEMLRDIQQKFLDRKFPTEFAYGPLRTSPDSTRDHYVAVERDRETADTIAAANGAHQNPRPICNRGLAVKATVYAQSTLEGARVNEHEFECEQIVDAFIVAFQEWGVESRALLGGVSPTIGETRYLKPSEFLGGEVWPGVAYLIRFRVPRGVTKLDYLGAALPVGTAAHVANVVEVFEKGATTHEDVPAP